MNQAPQSLWNEIHKTVPLKTHWGKAMFSKTEKEVEQTLAYQAEKMKAAGRENKVILAYQTVSPIWIEREAIAKFISQTERSELRQVLPDLASVNEATELMRQEHNLNARQTTILRGMIQRLNDTM